MHRLRSKKSSSFSPPLSSRQPSGIGGIFSDSELLTKVLGFCCLCFVQNAAEGKPRLPRLMASGINRNEPIPCSHPSHEHSDFSHRGDDQRIHSMHSIAASDVVDV